MEGGDGGDGQSNLDSFHQSTRSLVDPLVKDRALSHKGLCMRGKDPLFVLLVFFATLSGRKQEAVSRVVCLMAKKKGAALSFFLLFLLHLSH